MIVTPMNWSWCCLKWITFSTLCSSNMLNQEHRSREVKKKFQGNLELIIDLCKEFLELNSGNTGWAKPDAYNKCTFLAGRQLFYLLPRCHQSHHWVQVQWVLLMWCLLQSSCRRNQWATSAWEREPCVSSYSIYCPVCVRWHTCACNHASVWYVSN